MGMLHPAGLPAQLRSLKRTLVMGVVNVTPDSFSDGGRWFTPREALSQARRLLDEGADLIDVGGESTRPGAERVTSEQEIDRVLPVIEQLVSQGAHVSIDTMRSNVAREAVKRGATVINDVSGGLADPAMAAVAAETGVTFVAMHWRAHSKEMDKRDQYDDVVLDVSRELGERVTALTGAGVQREQIVLDPGLGFAKAGTNNWPLLAHLDVLQSHGLPVMVGASRKRFLGHLLARDASEVVPPSGRDAATHAVSALMAAAGVWCVRVHEVQGSLDAVRVGAALRAARAERPGAALADADQSARPDQSTRADKSARASGTDSAVRGE